MLACYASIRQKRIWGSNPQLSATVYRARSFRSGFFHFIRPSSKQTFYCATDPNCAIGVNFAFGTESLRKPHCFGKIALVNLPKSSRRSQTGSRKIVAPKQRRRPHRRRLYHPSMPSKKHRSGFIVNRMLAESSAGCPISPKAYPTGPWEQYPCLPRAPAQRYSPDRKKQPVQPKQPHWHRSFHAQ